MALHRDIFWVGRQWAVTGLGVQAVDQRLKGAFDVEVARLWEDEVPQRMRALAWINIDDFNKALDVARARFPAPPRKKALPLVESVLELLQPPAQEAPKAAPLMEARLPEATLIKPAPPPAAAAPIELPAEAPPSPQPAPKPAKSEPLAMRIEHVSAKFLPRWRIRHGSQR
jgi:hypothetical protein